MAERAELHVDGLPFSGWKSVSVNRSIEGLAGSFQFTASERHPDDVLARRARRGDACEVWLEGELVLKGYVDDVVRSHDAMQHEVSVKGRSLAADLVDCSATHEPGEWQGRTILQIAAELAAPFGVTVKADVDVSEPFPTFSIKASETVFSALERLARQRGVLLVSEPNGDVLITRAKSEREPLAVVLGTEALQAGVSDSGTERFSLYRFKGQQQGSDTLAPTQAAEPQGEATDPLVTRFRPRVAMAETQGTDSTLRERARWEAARRAGQAHRPVITVRDWRNSKGSLWRPNTLVRVVDDFLEVDGELLLVGVNYQSDSNGRRARLTLGRPEAFDVLAIPEKTTAGPELWITSEI